MSDIFGTAAVRASGLKADHPLATALSGRDDILTMTQQAHDAALTPDEPGGLSHGERAALCCRMARLNREEGLAAHFLALMAGVSAATAQLADPGFDGGDDARLGAFLRHTDLVTTDAKGVVAGDIAALKDAGVSEDDIVRLSELVAFISYQIRLTIGLRLMGETL
jgi:uncharacterized protein YciW